MKRNPMHPMFKSLFVIVVGLLVTLPWNVQAETLTLQDCLQRAVESNPDLRALDREGEMLDAERKSIRGHFLPVVKADSKFLVWDDESLMVFDLSFLEETFASMPEGVLAMMGDMQFPEDVSFTLHDQVTFTSSVTVAQPLVQIYKVYSGYKATESQAAAARKDRLTGERKLEMDVVHAYLGLISARRMLETAHAALNQVDVYEEKVKALMENELVERNAMMKIEVQRAEIKKGAFMAQKGIALAKAALNVYMHRDIHEPLEPVTEGLDDITTETEEISLEESQAQAILYRPELQSARLMLDAANMGRHVATADMLPELNAIFRYEFAEGMGAMQPRHQYFGGLVLEWNVWEWGATYYKLQQAKIRERQTKLRIESGEDKIRLEVEARRLDLDEAKKSLDVARAQLAEAKENLRIEQIRHEVQQSTTADLLQAQTLVLKAENDWIVAEMKIRENRAALRIARGESLLSDGE